VFVAVSTDVTASLVITHTVFPSGVIAIGPRRPGRRPGMPTAAPRQDRIRLVRLGCDQTREEIARAPS
jgi:hypothetical protein